MSEDPNLLPPPPGAWLERRERERAERDRRERQRRDAVLHRLRHAPQGLRAAELQASLGWPVGVIDLLAQLEREDLVHEVDGVWRLGAGTRSSPSAPAAVTDEDLDERLRRAAEGTTWRTTMEVASSATGVELARAVRRVRHLVDQGELEHRNGFVRRPVATVATPHLPEPDGPQRVPAPQPAVEEPCSSAAAGPLQTEVREDARPEGAIVGAGPDDEEGDPSEAPDPPVQAGVRAATAADTEAVTPPSEPSPSPEPEAHMNAVPLNVQIVELLSAHGPMTSGQLAERLGRDSRQVSSRLCHLRDDGRVSREGGGIGIQGGVWSLVTSGPGVPRQAGPPRRRRLEPAPPPETDPSPPSPPEPSVRLVGDPRSGYALEVERATRTREASTATNREVAGRLISHVYRFCVGGDRDRDVVRLLAAAVGLEDALPPIRVDKPADSVDR